MTCAAAERTGGEGGEGPRRTPRRERFGKGGQPSVGLWLQPGEQGADPLGQPEPCLRSGQPAEQSNAPAEPARLWIDPGLLVAGPQQQGGQVDPARTGPCASAAQ